MQNWHSRLSLLVAGLLLLVMVSCGSSVKIKSVAIDGGDQTIEVNEEVTLTATVKDEDDVTLTDDNAKVKWSTSDSETVTVNEDSGEIKGIKVGTATITATSNKDSDKKGTAEITVEAEAVQ